jgi:hypothetical protein
MRHDPPRTTPRERNEAQKRLRAKSTERAQQVRGLLLLALAALVFSILRAGVHRVFTPGWFRLW